MTPISINTDTTICIDIIDICVDASAIRVRFYEPAVVHEDFQTSGSWFFLFPERESADIQHLQLSKHCPHRRRRIDVSAVFPSPGGKNVLGD